MDDTSSYYMHRKSDGPWYWTLPCRSRIFHIFMHFISPALDCLFKSLFRLADSEANTKAPYHLHLVGDFRRFPVFPSRAINSETISVSWRHHVARIVVLNRIQCKKNCNWNGFITKLLCISSSRWQHSVGIRSPGTDWVLLWVTVWQVLGVFWGK